MVLLRPPFLRGYVLCHKNESLDGVILKKHFCRDWFFRNFCFVESLLINYGFLYLSWAYTIEIDSIKTRRDFQEGTMMGEGEEVITVLFDRKLRLKATWYIYRLENYFTILSCRFFCWIFLAENNLTMLWFYKTRAECSVKMQHITLK